MCIGHLLEGLQTFGHIHGKRWVGLDVCLTDELFDVFVFGFYVFRYFRLTWFMTKKKRLTWFKSSPNSIGRDFLDQPFVKMDLSTNLCCELMSK